MACRQSPAPLPRGERLVTENAVLLKRILEAETEADRQKRHNARLIAERDHAVDPSLSLQSQKLDEFRRQVENC
jgi:hypothetical protein